VLVWFDTAVVNREFAKVAQDAERQLRRPGVASELKGGVRLLFYVDRGLLGLNEELARAPFVSI
jgi:hypothetical protein